MLIDDTVHKQILQTEHKLLRIPTGGRLSSWLLKQRINRESGSLEDLNQGPPDFKSSALNHSATTPPLLPYIICNALLVTNYTVITADLKN